MQKLLSCEKLICSGQMVEIIAYSKRNPDVPKCLGFDSVLKDSVSPVVSACRARNKFRRLAFANAFRWFDSNGSVIFPRVVCFTFGKFITDVSTANFYWTKFVQRVNDSGKFLNGFQYQVVLEFQRSGRIHYHCLIYNQFYFEGVKDFFRIMWRSPESGGGNIRYQTFRGLDWMVNYCFKYFVKSFDDSRMKYKRRHFHSLGLLKPVEVLDEGKIHFLKNYYGDRFLTRSYSGIGFDVRVYMLPDNFNPLPDFILKT